MSEKDKSPHISVMLPEVIKYLVPKNGEVYVDCTFGAGGYSKSILDKADCTVIAIDMDPQVKKYVEKIKTSIKEFPNKKLIFVQGNFAEIESAVKKLGYEYVDGIVLDLGVSSMQLDTAERGFSFNQEASLDMRMSQDGIDAYEIVNHYSEEDLAQIIYEYGDERKSRQIAKKIVHKRSDKPIGTTTELANIVRSVVGKRGLIDPATKTFQAIRICVNNELKNLKRVLKASTALLKEQGRLVVVSFHSLEDKIVKDFLSDKSGKVSGVSRYIPLMLKEKSETEFKALTRKAVMCTDKEKNQNIRARSARLRAAVRIREEVNA